MRFVQFMQMVRVPADALAPFQSFSRRLTRLDANMSARPADCNDHKAALAQSNAEFQQLMMVEARMAISHGPDPAGSGEKSPDRVVPLLASPSTETCVAALRLGFREIEHAATGLLMSRPEGRAREQGQVVLNRVVRQQIDAFGRSPLSPEACEQTRRDLGELQAVVNSARSGEVQAVARPLSITQQPTAVQSTSRLATLPAPAPQPQPPAATSLPAERNEFLQCMDQNRRMYAALEREGNSLKASGRVSPGESSAFDGSLADYREWMQKTVHPIQCGVLADQMSKHLAIVRDAAATRVVPASASATQAAAVRPAVPQPPLATAPAPVAPARAVQSAPAPAPAIPATTATPPVTLAKAVPQTVQPPPPKPAAVTAPPTERRPQVPAVAPVRAPVPAPQPAQPQRSREPER